MGRPGPKGPLRPQVAVRMDEAGRAKVDELAKTAGVGRSEMVRRLLAAAVADPRIVRKVTGPTLTSDPAEQLAHERTADELAAVLKTLDWALARARRAQEVVEQDGVNRNSELALSAAIQELQRLRDQVLEVAR